MSPTVSLNSCRSLHMYDLRLPGPAIGHNNMADATKWKVRPTVVTPKGPELTHGKTAS
jgi:hypothetical protein